MGKYMKETFSPLLFKRMKQKGEEMCPYVDTKNYDDIPEKEFVHFLIFQDLHPDTVGCLIFLDLLQKHICSNPFQNVLFPLKNY